MGKHILPGIGTSLLCFFLGLCYCAVTPLWVPPDEERHYAYCEYIAEKGELPALRPESAGVRITEATHPPLYYIIASALCIEDGASIHEKITVHDGPGYRTIRHPQSEETFPYSGDALSAYAIRLMSILFGALTVYFIYLIALEIVPGQILFAAAAAVFAGTLPQFLHVSASVSNETLSALLSAVLLFCLLKYYNGKESTSFIFVLGLILGACILTKISTIIYIPIVCTAVVLKHKGHWKHCFISLSITGVITCLVSGWWFLRNWIVYNDPLFSKALVEVLPFTLRYVPVSVGSLIHDAQILFVSFFGCFGALQVPIGRLHIISYTLITLAGCAGLCRLLSEKKSQPAGAKRYICLCLSAIGLALLFLFILNMKAYVFMGKYLFVVFAPISIALCMGILHCFPYRWRNSVCIVFIIIVCGLSADVFARVLKPAFREPRVNTMIKQPVFCCRTEGLGKHNTVGQTFNATRDKICGIRVMFSNPERIPSGRIYFSLQDAASGNIIRKMRLEYDTIVDTRFFFLFPPVAGSRDKQYHFTFREDDSKRPGISLWYSDTDNYAGGTMTADSVPASGDFYFTVYYFTGESPDSIWEGAETAVIRQGEYIPVRQLQLYAELPRNMRERTIIHRKLEQAEKYMMR